MWEYDRWRTLECDEEESGRCVFVTVSVLCCVIVLCVRVVFDLCTTVFIDNRSPSLNNAGFHCFVLHCYTFVNERRSQNKILQSTNSQATRFFHQHIWPSEPEKLEASDLQIMNTMASAAKTSSKKLTALKDRMNRL
ncbi:hypothetical protein T08_10456 [Trichinella sp. T8]|nr:hypothetical protein T08_10456 [Trichinella sp. T8]